MMMGPGMVVPDQADFDGVFALLALAADPKGFQSRVTELQKVTAQAKETSEAAAKADTAAKAREAAVSKREEALIDKVAATEALQLDLKRRTEKTIEREAAVAQCELLAHRAREEWDAEEQRRQSAVILGERNFQDSIRDRQAELGRRESVAAAATQAAEQLIAEATRLKEDYEARLAKMVAMASGVKA